MMKLTQVEKFLIQLVLDLVNWFNASFTLTFMIQNGYSLSCP